MIIIDEKTIFDIIIQKKPVTVALNAPDGMLPQVQQTAINITKKFDIPAFVLADTTWGTCDLNSNGAKVLGAEILFNIGHTNKLETFPGEQDNVIMIDAFDDISFDNVIPKAIEILKGKTISLITDSQHLHQVDSVKKKLEEIPTLLLLHQQCKLILVVSLVLVQVKQCEQHKDCTKELI